MAGKDCEPIEKCYVYYWFWIKWKENDMYIYNLALLFTDLAEKYENKKAIIFYDGSSISFEELDKYSNKIANYLRKNRNLLKYDVVAIQNNKTKFGFATMLACLKLGVVYTNFDYTNPTDRISKIFNTAEPKLIIADEHNDTIEALCEEMTIPYIDKDGAENDIENQVDDCSMEIINTIDGNNPAYIMFTSGSTGIPKGVVISHKSILNFIKWGKDTYGITDDDVMSNVNPIYFDNSVFDFYCSVFNGVTMIAVPKKIVEKPAIMLDILEQNGCTFWFSVPSMLIFLKNMKLLTKDRLQTVRIFSFGGEAYPKELLRKLYETYCNHAKFYNVYGPTEGTCICSAYLITEDDIEADGLAPLGHIAPNFGWYVIDEEGNKSERGELCISGEQLALGYYNDEERTNKSFVRCPFISTFYERMYKTGDLVEIRDEKLYFIGRVDNQIKHMGYRIELEEIENALIRIANVKQCAVVHTVSKNQFSRLIAYVATDIENAEEKVFKTELRKYVPEYMVPNEFVFVKELPKNANGKVDRKTLSDIMKN